MVGMGKARVITAREGGGFTMSLPPGPCADCDSSWETAPISHVRGRLRERMVSGCTVHSHSFRFATADGSTLTVRRTIGDRSRDIAVLIPSLPNVTTPTAMRSVAEIIESPHVWGIDVNRPNATVRQSLAAALDWAAQQHDAETMQSWLDVGVTNPALASHWIAQGFWPGLAQPWLDRGIDAFSAGAWRRAYVRPEDVPVGMTGYAHAMFCALPGLPKTAEWSDLSQVCTPRFAGIGRKQGQGPAAVRALAEAVAPTTEASMVHSRVNGMQSQDNVARFTARWVWTEEQNAQACEVALLAKGLDWADVAACLRGGLGLVEALAHVAEGRPMEPLRVMAALLTSGTQSVQPALS